MSVISLEMREQSSKNVRVALRYPDHHDYPGYPVTAAIIFSCHPVYRVSSSTAARAKGVRVEGESSLMGYQAKDSSGIASEISFQPNTL